MKITRRSLFRILGLTVGAKLLPPINAQADAAQAIHRFYLDGDNGDDRNDGTEPTSAVRSLRVLFKLIEREMWMATKPEAFVAFLKSTQPLNGNDFPPTFACEPYKRHALRIQGVYDFTELEATWVNFTARDRAPVKLLGRPPHGMLLE